MDDKPPKKDKKNSGEKETDDGAKNLPATKNKSSLSVKNPQGTPKQQQHQQNQQHQNNQNKPQQNLRLSTAEAASACASPTSLSPVLPSPLPEPTNVLSLPAPILSNPIQIEGHAHNQQSNMATLSSSPSSSSSISLSLMSAMMSSSNSSNLPSLDTNRPACAVASYLGYGNAPYNWQSSKTTIKDRLAYLYNTEIMSDIHFMVGTQPNQQKIPAHKFVLCVGSAVFDAQFNGPMATSEEVIDIPDVEPAAFLALLRFLYSDEVQICSDTVMTTLYAAKKYAVPALEKACVEFLKRNLSSDNAFMLLTQARLFDEPQLAALCLETIDKNTSEALNADGFTDIDLETLCVVLERDTLGIRECKLFAAICRWCEAECTRKNLPQTPENKRQVLGRALSLIRFPLMTVEEFAQGAAQSGLLEDRILVQLFLYFTVNPKPHIEFLDVPRCCLTGKEQVVSRFCQIESRWGYSGTSDRIRFMVNRRIFVVGFGLYGSIHGPHEFAVNIQSVLENGSVCLLELQRFQSSKYSTVIKNRESSRSKFLEWVEESFKDIKVQTSKQLSKSSDEPTALNASCASDTMSTETKEDAATIVERVSIESHAEEHESIPTTSSDTMSLNSAETKDTATIIERESIESHAEKPDSKPTTSNNRASDPMSESGIQNPSISSQETNEGPAEEVNNEGLIYTYTEEDISREESDVASEMEIINTKCVGKRISVPIENLVQPSAKRLVRDINLDHVQELEDQFSKGQDLFTILVGTISPSVPVTVLQEIGHPVIEVIGGNHTRQALQNLSRKGNGRMTHVMMDIYENITDTQALMLGMAHNAQHEHSKKTTFQDTVRLLRNLYELAMERYPESSRKATISWRSQAALVLGVDKLKLKNQFQTHLHCASLSKNLWDIYTKFSEAWEKGKITKQLKIDLKQTHIQMWTKVKEEDRKIQLLKSVADGEITFLDFKECCLNSKPTKKNEKTSKRNETVQIDKPRPSEIHTEKEKASESVRSNRDCKEAYKERTIKAEKRVKELEKLLSQKDKAEEGLQLKINIKDKELNDLMTVNEQLQGKIKHMQQKLDRSEEVNAQLMRDKIERQEEIHELEEKLTFAEEAAMRARNRVKEINKGEQLLSASSENYSAAKVKKRKTDLEEKVEEIKEVNEIDIENIIHSDSSKTMGQNDTSFQCDGTNSTFRVMFKEPVEILPNTSYTACATLKGPDSYYGSKGLRKVTHESLSSGKVTFQFTYAAGNNNGTSVEDGQIPEIIFYT